MQSLIVLLLFECPFLDFVEQLDFWEPDEYEFTELLLPKLEVSPLIDTGVLMSVPDDDPVEKLANGGGCGT